MITVTISTDPTIEIALRPHLTLLETIKTIYKRLNKPLRDPNYLERYFGSDALQQPLSHWVETENADPDSPVRRLAHLLELDISVTPQAAEEKEAGNAGPFRLTSELPSGFLFNVFSFFSSKDLARAGALVSTNFLIDANEEDDPEIPRENKVQIGFMPGRNQELDTLFELLFASLTDAAEEEKKAESDQQPDIMLVQRAWLQTGFQKNSLARKLFLETRAEILAGRLSVKEAIEQIASLANADSRALLSADVLLAKIGRESLKPWHVEALTHGFNLSDLLSDWISPSHVDALNEANEALIAAAIPADDIAEPAVPPERWTVENLRGLQEYQVQGLQAFTLEQVRSFWFSPVHVELLGHPYHLLAEDLSGRMAISIFFGRQNGFFPVNADEWRLLIHSPFHGFTPLYTAVAEGSLAIVAAMRDACHFTPEEWQSEITKPLLVGPNAGMTPLWAAAANGHAAVLDAFQFSPEVWLIEITKPLVFGPMKGITPLCVATMSKGQAEVLAAMREACGFTEEVWKAFVDEHAATTKEAAYQAFRKEQAVLPVKPKEEEKSPDQSATTLFFPQPPAAGDSAAAVAVPADPVHEQDGERPLSPRNVG